MQSGSGARWILRRGGCSLANLHHQRRGLGVSSGVLCCQCIGRIFARSDIYTAAERRPHRISLRFESYCFGVGDSVAQLGGLTAPNDAGAGIKMQDLEAVHAEHLDGTPVLVTLLLQCPLLDPAVFLPAREEYPAHKEYCHSDDHPRVPQKDANLCVRLPIRILRHPCLLLPRFSEVNKVGDLSGMTV